MQERIAKNILIFLMRAPLKGEETGVFVECLQALQEYAGEKKAPEGAELEERKEG